MLTSMPTAHVVYTNSSTNSRFMLLVFFEGLNRFIVSTNLAHSLCAKIQLFEAKEIQGKSVKTTNLRPHAGEFDSDCSRDLSPILQ